jgi:hypothetical protein
MQKKVFEKVKGGEIEDGEEEFEIVPMGMKTYKPRTKKRTPMNSWMWIRKLKKIQNPNLSHRLQTNSKKKADKTERSICPA